MSPVAFLDANIPIYAAGRAHPLKEPCVQILTMVADQPEAFVTDAEVLQELLHRYLALRLWPQGRLAFRSFAELMRDRVESVEATDVEDAATLADRFPELGGRDVLHAAVMERLRVAHIVSADAGFERVPRVQRLDPLDVEDWKGLVLS